MQRQQQFITGRLLIHDLAGRCGIPSTFPVAVNSFSAFEFECKDVGKILFCKNPDHSLAKILPQEVTVYYSIDGATVFTWTACDSTENQD